MVVVLLAVDRGRAEDVLRIDGTDADPLFRALKKEVDAAAAQHRLRWTARSC
jgi:glutathione peroxidase-family protein